jgi:hypothetical protein
LSRSGISGGTDETPVPLVLLLSGRAEHISLNDLIKPPDV